MPLLLQISGTHHRAHDLVQLPIMTCHTKKMYLFLRLTPTVPKFFVKIQVEKRKGWVTGKWLRANAGQQMDNLIALRLSALLLASRAENLALNRAYKERLGRISRHISDFEKLRPEDKERIFKMLHSTGMALASFQTKTWDKFCNGLFLYCLI